MIFFSQHGVARVEISSRVIMAAIYVLTGLIMLFLLFCSSLLFFFNKALVMTGHVDILRVLL